MRTRKKQNAIILQFNFHTWSSLNRLEWKWSREWVSIGSRGPPCNGCVGSQTNRITFWLLLTRLSCLSHTVSPVRLSAFRAISGLAVSTFCHYFSLVCGNKNKLFPKILTAKASLLWLLNWFRPRQWHRIGQSAINFCIDDF
jgi:hypothetical protein